MSSHPALRPDTGVPRGPERYGSVIQDDDRDALRDQLQRFEAKIDPADEEQVAVRETPIAPVLCACPAYGAKGAVHMERERDRSRAGQSGGGVASEVTEGGK
jgi:hypothetical protein